MNIYDLVNELRYRLERMTPEERLELLGELKSGYCPYCGIAEERSACPCYRDD